MPARPRADSHAPIEISNDVITGVLGEIAFDAAMHVLGDPPRLPGSRWLPTLEAIIHKVALAHPALQQAPQALSVPSRWRYTRAFSMFFLLHEEARLAYVPQQPLNHPGWLTLQFTLGGHTATTLHAWLAAQGRHIPLDALTAVAPAPTDTTGTPVTPVARATARTFLADKAWLEARITGKRMTDGDVVDELRQAGCACDRSTVAWWRREHHLDAAWRRGDGVRPRRHHETPRTTPAPLGDALPTSPRPRRGRPSRD